MKPLLRVVLVIDALLLVAFGLLFLLTPWTSLYNALQLTQVEPALAGQGFGIALLGLAWLALHASIDGAMTRAVARTVGHVNWLTGVLMLVWLIALRSPSLSASGTNFALWYTRSPTQLTKKRWKKSSEKRFDCSTKREMVSYLDQLLKVC